MFKVVASPYNTDGVFTEEELLSVSLRASSLFSLGLRAFYAFIPVVRTLPQELGWLQAVMQEAHGPHG